MFGRADHLRQRCLAALPWTLDQNGWRILQRFYEARLDETPAKGVLFKRPTASFDFV